MNVLNQIRNCKKKKQSLFMSFCIFFMKARTFMRRPNIFIVWMLLKRNINHKHIIQHKYTNKPHNSEWNEENEERNHKEKSRNITRNEINRFAENLNKFFMCFLNLSLWYFYLCLFFFVQIPGYINKFYIASTWIRHTEWERMRARSCM